jgi:pyruvate dehydrogenase E2 component (dihydrolipoamide acetyltransferase)
MSDLARLAMPKWGLSMTEGRLVAWLVDEGAQVQVGDPVAEVETEKINGTVEATAAGTVLRRVGEAGEVIPVGGLLGVVGDPATPPSDVDALVAAFQASFVPPVAGDEGPAPETATIGERTVRYQRLGSGDDVVVLIHGFGGDMTNWLFNQQALADEGRTVYAIDLPGHGGSAKDVGDGSVAELAGVVGGLLWDLGATSVHLVGHSLGGAVAARLALDDPGRVRSLVLIAPVGFGDEINGAYIDGFIGARTRRDLVPVLGLLFADESLVTRQMAEDVLRYKRLDGVDAALRAMAAASFAGGRQSVDLAGPLGGADVPVLVVWGAGDRILSAAQAEAAPARASVIVLEGQGHSPHMEAAGEVNRRIGEFLSTTAAVG